MKTAVSSAVHLGEYSLGKLPESYFENLTAFCLAF